MELTTKKMVKYDNKTDSAITESSTRPMKCTIKGCGDTCSGDVRARHLHERSNLLSKTDIDVTLKSDDQFTQKVTKSLSMDTISNL